MDRRDFLAGAAAVAGAAALPLPSRASISSSRRNVLLIISEQTQHDICSFAGGPAKTPALERLASDATMFTTACTTTGLCSPARSCLFTGKLGHRTGMDDNGMMWHSRLNGLDMKYTTLIEWAHNVGARVGYFGKWHLGADGPIYRGADAYPPEGFERRDLKLAGKSDPKPNFSVTQKYYEHWERDDAPKTWEEKPQYWSTDPNGYEQTSGHLTSAQAVQFLSEQPHDKPFFLTVSYHEVHPPYSVPAPYNTMYDPAKTKLPASLNDTFAGKPPYQNDIMWPFHDTGHLTEEDWRKIIAFEHGSLSMLDRAVGEVLDALDKSGERNNTLIIFTSDHGDMLGAHNRFDKGPYCYEEIMRVPLLVSMPGANTRSVDRSVSTIDIPATIVDWMELKPDQPPVDSTSLLPLCQHGDSARGGADQIFYRYEWYNGLWFGIRAVRTPDYMYAFNPAAQDELYDLRLDKAEMHNRINDHDCASIVSDLRARLLAHLRSVQDPEAQRLESFLGTLKKPRPVLDRNSGAALTGHV